MHKKRVLPMNLFAKKSLPIILSLLFTVFFVHCTQDTAGETSEEIIPVEVFPAQTQTIYNSLELVGDITADQNVRIFSKVSDRIVRFHVDMGDYVNEGDLIAEVENSTIRSQVNQAESNLQQAQSQLRNLENEFARMEMLLRENAVSQQQYDATETQLEATRAQVRALREGLNQAESRLADSYIRSPLNGLIGQRFVEQGDMVSPQSPVVTVVKMDTVKVIVNVIERYVPQVSIGLEAIISVDALQDTTFHGTVSKISPVIDPMTRMVTTEIRIPNPDLLLKPGMFSNVELLLESKPNAVVIPKYAIMQRTEIQRNQLGEQEIIRDSYVYIAENDIARSRPVTTGIEREGLVEITSGLNPGDPVVLLGQNQLQDSSRISIESEETQI